MVATAGGIGPPGAYSMFGSPVINDVGSVVSHADVDTGSRGIFTGPDPTVDKVIELGDPLFGSIAESLVLYRGLNNKNGIAFYYKLADGRSGIARAKLGTIAAPQIHKEGNTVFVSIDSISATRIYQLQVASGPTAGTFVDVGEPQSAPAGTSLTFTDSAPADATRFYRVHISTYR